MRILQTDMFRHDRLQLEPRAKLYENRRILVQEQRRGGRPSRPLAQQEAVPDWNGRSGLPAIRAAWPSELL